MTVVSLLVSGSAGYAIAARECVLALLTHTEFPIHVAADPVGCMLLPKSPRIHLCSLPERPPTGGAAPFMEKFVALEQCLAAFADDTVLMIDVDAILTERISEPHVEAILGDHPIAMVEQKCTLGEGKHRRDFLRHYTNVTLAAISPGAAAPRLEDFRYFNSGVVFLRRDEATRIIRWVRGIVAERPGVLSHDERIIADQDFLQVWTNTIRPGSCRELDWRYNHCGLWHEGYPRGGAVIHHFSNYLRGPDLEGLAAMRALRRPSDAGQPVTDAEDPPAADWLTAVIVTHNSADVLPLCLDLTMSVTDRCIVVDNASTDETVSIAGNSGAMVVANSANAGFAKAANQGVAETRTETVCLLNPDCLLTADMAAAARAKMQEDRRQILVPDYRGWRGERMSGRQPGYSGRKILADLLVSGGARKALRLLQRHRSFHDETWHWPLAACMFVDRAVLAELGGFNESCHLSMGDVRLARYAVSQGVPTRSLGADAIHLGAHGAKTDTASRNRLFVAARLQYVRDSYGRLGRSFEAAARPLMRIVSLVSARRM